MVKNKWSQKQTTKHVNQIVETLVKYFIRDSKRKNNRTSQEHHIGIKQPVKKTQESRYAFYGRSNMLVLRAGCMNPAKYIGWEFFK